MSFSIVNSPSTSGLDIVVALANPPSAPLPFAVTPVMLASTAQVIPSTGAPQLFVNVGFLRMGLEFEPASNATPSDCSTTRLQNATSASSSSTAATPPSPAYRNMA